MYVIKTYLGGMKKVTVHCIVYQICNYFNKNLHQLTWIQFFYFDATALQKHFKRKSRLEVFCKKGALSDFVKFTGKHLYQSLFFNKVAGSEISKNTCFYRTHPLAASDFKRKNYCMMSHWHKYL